MRFESARFDDEVGRMLEAARVPGAAITVVQGSEIVHARGYGVRDPAGAALTEDTLFPIASTSKAMTAALLSQLADRGQFVWDRPVRQHLPDFALGDPIRSELVTPRDLILMRTGLPRHDWLWIDNPFDRSELDRLLPSLELTAGFRERFQYNNLTVALAGHVAERITGESWEALVAAHLFAPLGMTAVRFERPADGNVTDSWHEDAQRNLVLSHRYLAAHTGPSGGAIHASVKDMAKWVAFNLSGEAHDGTRLLSPGAFEDFHRPAILIGSDLPGLGARAAYGLGWQFDDHRGSERLFHGGYLHDVNTDVSLFPAEGVGFVSFVNAGGARLAECLSLCAFDILSGREPAMLWRRKLERYEDAIRRRLSDNQPVARTRAKDGSVPLEGPYRHPGYGALSFRRLGSELELRRGSLVVALEPQSECEWSAPLCTDFGIQENLPWDPTNPISFEQRGGEAFASVRFEPAAPPIRFAREATEDGGASCAA